MSEENNKYQLVRCQCLTIHFLALENRPWLKIAKISNLHRNIDAYFQFNMVWVFDIIYLVMHVLRSAWVTWKVVL